MCRAAESDAHPPVRLNYRAIAALNVCNCAHFYSLCSIFSYAAFLSVDNGWVATIDQAGFMAGLLPTMVMAGRIATSWAWGMLSDRIGGRRCLQLCLASIAIGNLLFGLASQAWLALLVRFVFLGACNGYVALIGPLSQVIGGAERQSEVITLVFASGPVIQMVGPALGGLLYGSLLPAFPAIVPSMIGTLIALIGFAAITKAMPREPVRSTSRLKPPQQEQQSAVEMESAAVPPAKHMDDDDGDDTCSTRGSSADGGPLGRSTLGDGMNGNAAKCDEVGGNTDSGVQERQLKMQLEPTPSAPSRSPGHDPPPPSAQQGTSSLCAVLCTHPIPLVALVRATSGLLLFGMFDVVPLWLAASRGAGGLALNEKQLGMTLALASLVMLPWVLQPMGR
jgi:hypothetical protein